MPPTCMDNIKLVTISQLVIKSISKGKVRITTNKILVQITIQPTILEEGSHFLTNQHRMQHPQTIEEVHQSSSIIVLNTIEMRAIPIVVE